MEMYCDFQLLVIVFDNRRHQSIPARRVRRGSSKKVAFTSITQSCLMFGYYLFAHLLLHIMVVIPLLQLTSKLYSLT